VVYFNFQLAREMGLIGLDHPSRMNPVLEKKILETFAIQIVNEYDQLRPQAIEPNSLKRRSYMATRYLQLQHADKTGRTSGDGRSIWNGSLQHSGQVWDVSSRGTGVTRLAPGAVRARRPLKTGVGTYGYGCGLADVHELLGSALMSEVFHREGVGTERVLTIIETRSGYGIGVRAAPNLLRPAHLLLFLKQGRTEAYRKAWDYLIDRQIVNKRWAGPPARKTARDRWALAQIARDFGRFTARLEREYIFAWLDWDGDNVLADAGIIDYGSIRRFGLRHDQYRYDDVDRWSTNLNEQVGKARMIVQALAQGLGLLAGQRRPLAAFRNHWAVSAFNTEYTSSLKRLSLMQLGFDEPTSALLLSRHSGAADAALKSLSLLERRKVTTPQKRVADGVNRPAAFNTRRLLREIADELKGHSDPLSRLATLDPSWALDRLASGFCQSRDRRLRPALSRQIRTFLIAYANLIRLSAKGSQAVDVSGILSRLAHTHRMGRLTGNGSEFVVQEILKSLKRKTPVDQIQRVLDLFIDSQSRPASPSGGAPLVSLSTESGRLFERMVLLAIEADEDI
jgi:uncharacterized protein YdiU (UPF0061 family)